MRILTICEQGNKRSVFTRNILHHQHDVISFGIATSAPETITMLCEWTDKILLAEPQMIDMIPEVYRIKVDTRFTIGEDVWPTYITGPLRDLIYTKLKFLGYI